MAGCVPCVAQAVASDAGKKTDLTAMNIEDLMNIKPASASDPLFNSFIQDEFAFPRDPEAFPL
jgi:hypothetical protein